MYGRIELLFKLSRISRKSAIFIFVWDVVYIYIYKVFRYGGAGLDEISIRVLFPFKLLKQEIFWLVGQKVPSANYSWNTGSFVTKLGKALLKNMSNLVLQNAVPVALTIAEIEDHTAKEETLQKVIESIEKGWKNKSARDPDLEPYSKSRNQLCIAGRLILKENKIVIPKELQQRILQIVHEKHMDIVKTKQTLRNKSLVAYTKSICRRNGYNMCFLSIGYWRMQISTIKAKKTTWWSLAIIVCWHTRSFSIWRIYPCYHRWIFLISWNQEHKENVFN